MSDYHILEQDEKKKGFKIAFHFPVPAGNNNAGRSWRLSLTEWKTQGGENLISIVPNIDPIEQGKIDIGEINEVIRFFKFTSVTLSPIQKKDEIDAQWNNIKNDEEIKLSTILEHWGQALNLS